MFPSRSSANRFRLAELRDTVGNSCAIEPRVTQWSSSSADIRALRKLARDGPLSVDPVSRNLLVVSMSAAHVENDKAGNVSLTYPESTEGGRLVSILKWPEGAPLNLG